MTTFIVKELRAESTILAPAPAQHKRLADPATLLYAKPQCLSIGISRVIMTLFLEDTRSKTQARKALMPLATFCLSLCILGNCSRMKM